METKIKKEEAKIKFEYGAMSTRYSCEASNKLIAYITMIFQYKSSAHLIALYEPEEIIKEDNWICFTGQISERLDEIFIKESGKNFDEYFKENLIAVKECLNTIKQIC